MASTAKTIDEATEFKLRLSTSKGIAEALTNIIAHPYRPGDLYDALIGCEWSAEALAWQLEANARLVYVHNWKAVRTAPRSLVVEGTDSFGNTEVLYLVLGENEPDMFDGITLRVSLTNHARVALALSNILSCKCSPARFTNYLYEAAEKKWDAVAFANAVNRAYRDGAVRDRNWKAKYTRDDKCAITSRDSLGNERTLIIGKC